MDLLPDITMPAEEIKEDLAIIETEDLKSDPFIRAPPIKPEQPKTEPKKAKRQVSEKQKAHLANARKLAKERKEKAKKEQGEEKKQDIKEYAQVITDEPKNAQTDIGTAPSQGPNGFEQWLGYMNQFADIKKAQEDKERMQREEQERKEQELEAKYFAKFQEKYNLDNNQKDIIEKKQPRKLPKSSLDILAPPQPKDDFGPFGSYF